MTATQEQLAALAALVGITPETHPSLAKKDYVYPNGVGHGNPRQLVGVRLDASKLPALDTAAGDDVFFTSFMRWCQKEDLLPEIWCCAAFVDDGEPFGAMLNDDDNWIYAATMTLALLRACQAAGVPEIVEIFGRGDHDAR